MDMKNLYCYSFRFHFDGREFVLSTTSPISLIDAWNGIGKFLCECVDQSKITADLDDSVHEGKCCLDG